MMIRGYRRPQEEGSDRISRRREKVEKRLRRKTLFSPQFGHTKSAFSVYDLKGNSDVPSRKRRKRITDIVKVDL